MAKEAYAEFSLEKVNTAPSDESMMSDIQKKHFPSIFSPGTVEPGETFGVSIITGEHLEHPNELNHFMMWTELYAGDRFIGRTEFSPKITEPETCFKIKLDRSEDLIAYSMCNMHGLWKNSVHVEVR